MLPIPTERVRVRRRLCRLVVVLASVPVAAVAQSTLYESEPNDAPVEANPVAGAVVLAGSMTRGDQDGFRWTVSDVDAQKRWTFELQGIPGRLTIAEVIRVEYAENGVEVVGVDKLMKMGTRDGLTPSIHRDLLFEPGEYLIGIAYAGGGGEAGGGGMFRPPAGSLSFAEDGSPRADTGAAAAPDPEPGGYRFLIAEGARLPVADDPEPRATRERAKAMRLGRESAIYESRGATWYSFEFDADAAAQRWEVRAQAPVGRPLKGRLMDAAGRELATASVDSRGRLAFPDLAPESSRYYLELASSEPGFIHAVSSEAVGTRTAGEEAEPNGEWPLATRVDLSRPVTGRIGTDNEWDYFRFTLDEATTDRLLTLRLEASAAQSLELCLLGEDKSRLQCRRATPPIELPDLVLAPGEWGLSVTRAKQGIEYSISLGGQGSIEAGMEAEPNDAIEYATSVPANLRIGGRLSDQESDYFRFVTVEKPQLWRFQVLGDGITEVMAYDGSGAQLARVRPSGGQRRLRVDNLFLLPGQHFLRVSGDDGGRYTVMAVPLGPPDPDGEREPNDDTSRMQRLAMAQTRRGLLAESDDVDLYRFFLPNWDHVRLTVAPPLDGVVTPHLYWYGQPLAIGRPSGPGEPLSLSGIFPPGDYHLSLRPTKTSENEYRVGLERLERFSCPTDCEPNGMRSLYLAAPLPPDLVLEGRAGGWDDTDVYRLPLLTQPSELVARPVQPVKNVWVTTDSRDDLLAWDRDAQVYRGALPAGEPALLHVRSDGADYRLELEFSNGPVARRPGSLPVELELDLDAEAVSAYRTHGQRVTGELRLRNIGSKPLLAELETATSDHRWRAWFERERVEVAPGAEAGVPLAVEVPRDAWADRPVRISVVARAGDGAAAETWKEILVDREAAPVDPTWGWEVPDALRGGFNAAWAALGGKLAGEYPGSLGARFEQAIDGMTVNGNSLQLRGWDGRAERALTVELAGGALVPVAGIALNHFGAKNPLTDIRRATLLLSADGADYREVLSLETLPVRTEQFFALEEPVAARFARLRVEATFDQQLGAGGASLGEWKVITRPGHDLSGGRGFNLADRALGGHVVWADPAISIHWDSTVLTEKEEKPSVRLRAGQNLEWVLGFHHGRAAQLARLEWVESAGTAADRRFRRVTVAASTVSPVGPWQPLAEWELQGRDEAVLELDQRTWVRFLKFTAHGPDKLEWRSAPDTIRVWERPTGGEYHSILGEWGHARREAHYEAREGLDPEPELVAAGNDSRAKAAAIEPGSIAAGEVALGRHEQWYRMRIPPGRNTLAVTLSGDPTVRTVVALEDEEGNPVRVARQMSRSTLRRHAYEAVVEPGSSYYLRVSEPPRNVVFTWDTSASVMAYLPTIYNSLAAFSSEVVPGREAVNLVPFGRGPLLREWYGEPYVLQTILNDDPRGQSSSEAEATLGTATRLLEPLAGTKAIVVITDAATNRHARMWDDLREVQPRVFGVGIGGTGAADEEQDRFQDWTSVNGGHYHHLVYDGEMEVAFDRATTLLRRPAAYRLEVDVEHREAPGPGRLTVTGGGAGGGRSGGPSPAAAGGAAIELILDASGSMLQRMGEKRRIEVAKEVLSSVVGERIPAATPLALRVFGHRVPNACRTDLEAPLEPLDPAAMKARIQGIDAMNLARTPIADSLAKVATDLRGASGRKVVVLVTDGEETCEGDPEEVIQGLRDGGFDVAINIVGFAIDDTELESTFERWAELGGGRYFSARDPAGLSEALIQALRTPFAVYDRGGSLVAEGVVDGAALELAAGVYRVVVATSPPTAFDDVEVAGEREVSLDLAAGRR